MRWDKRIMRLRRAIGKSLGMSVPCSPHYLAELAGYSDDAVYSWLSNKREPNHNSQLKLIELENIYLS